MSEIIILDYGMGNLRSVQKIFLKLGVKCKISDSYSDFDQAKKIVIPGVGNFAHGMKNINELGIKDLLSKKALIEQVPVLGICLGAQLFCKYSEEGNTSGLGWFDAKIKRFNVSNTLKYKVPHVGWNNIKVLNSNKLDESINVNDPFYFIHSFYIKCNDDKNKWMSTNYDGEFTSAIKNKNIYGVQFHPEKSHDNGLEILKNFAEL